MTGGRKTSTGKDAITTAERRRQALELRKQGKKLDDIAAEVGYANAGGAFKAIRAALQATLQEPADELRKLECERLDAALAGIWPKVIKGDTWAIDRMLGIMDRRAKLLGLDAPTKRDDTFTLVLKDEATKAAKARRYGELRLMEQAGAIKGLRLQPRYPLTINGVAVCTYVADFAYIEHGQWIVEDVKGGNATKTATYRIKRKLMQACHGIIVHEITA